MVTAELWKIISTISTVLTKEADTVSIKMESPTTHIMGLIMILKTLVTQPIPVLKEIMKVKIDPNQNLYTNIWTLANYATGADGP